MGDTFYLFSQAVTNGNLITITAPAGVTFTNNLAVDDSITVLPSTNPTNITTAFYLPNQLVLSWPADHTGWRLQVQTNSLTTGLATNWFEVPGSASVSIVTNLVDPNNGSMFYRLVYP